MPESVRRKCLLLPGLLTALWLWRLRSRNVRCCASCGSLELPVPGPLSLRRPECPSEQPNPLALNRTWLVPPV